MGIWVRLYDSVRGQRNGRHGRLVIVEKSEDGDFRRRVVVTSGDRATVADTKDRTKTSINHT